MVGNTNLDKRLYKEKIASESDCNAVSYCRNCHYHNFSS